MLRILLGHIRESLKKKLKNKILQKFRLFFQTILRSAQKGVLPLQ